MFCFVLRTCSDMGCHIDGFIAVVAHTLVVTSPGGKVSGRKADVCLAAHYASEAALRLVKPGNEVIKYKQELYTHMRDLIPAY